MYNFIQYQKNDVSIAYKIIFIFIFIILEIPENDGMIIIKLNQFM